MRLLLIGLILASRVVSGANVPYDLGHDAVPITLGANRLPTVEVSINESGPHRFLLDSGSNRTAISSALARRLGVESLGRTTVMAVTGAIAAEIDVVMLTKISVGTLTKHELPALALADERLKAQNVDGLLGQDVLMTQSHTIDYRQRLLRWHFHGEPGARPAKDSVAIEYVSGMWLAALPQDPHGKNVVWLVPDSGAQALVLFEANLPASLQLSPLPDVATSTFFGPVTTRTARVRRLQVGSVVHFDQPAVIVQRHPDPADGHGLLPLAAYDSVTFSVERRQMTISAR